MYTKQFEELLKNMTNNREDIFRTIIDSIQVTFQNKKAFEKIKQTLDSAVKVNENLLFKALVTGLNKQIEISSQLLTLVLIYISSENFSTDCRQIRMKLNPEKSSEILQEALKEKMGL